jgi:hypothetical protein
MPEDVDTIVYGEPRHDRTAKYVGRKHDSKYHTGDYVDSKTSENNIS